MYVVFIPLPEEDPRAPALVKSQYPMGVPIKDVCAANGWVRQAPADAVVYDADGTLLQGTPPAPAPEPEPLLVLQEDEAAKPPTEPKKKGA